MEGLGGLGLVGVRVERGEIRGTFDLPIVFL